MIYFITDRTTPNEPEILTPVKDKTLLIVSLEGQGLGCYDPPVDGWSYERLIELSSSFPEQWAFCGADALIGEQFVGSTEI